MKDVTDRAETLRSSTAEVRLTADGPEIERLLEDAHSWGELRGSIRAVSTVAVKRTADLLPGCQPLSPGGIEVLVERDDEGFRIRVTVRGIAVADFDMEALTGASVGSLHALERLRYRANRIELGGARLLSSRGGLADWREEVSPPVRAGVVVLSDSVHAGNKVDKAGVAVRDRLLELGSVDVPVYEILPDEPDRLRARAQELIDDGLDLLVTVGGTGLWSRDRTVEAIQALIDRPVPGISEAARAHGQRRIPYAMLSRGVSGLAGSTMILTFPGSTKGALESCDAVFPGLLHAFRIMRDPSHDRTSSPSSHS